MKESGLPQSWQVVWKKEEKKLKLRGEPVLSLALSWPEIQRGGRGGRRVSQYYRQVVQTWRKRWEKELYCRACLDLSACQEEGRAFRTWSARLEGQVTFQNEETLSVVMDAWEDWGDGRPLQVRTADIWTLPDGRPLAKGRCWPERGSGGSCLRSWQSRGGAAEKRRLFPGCGLCQKLPKALSWHRCARTQEGMEYYIPQGVLAVPVEGVVTFQAPVPKPKVKRRRKRRSRQRNDGSEKVCYSAVRGRRAERTAPRRMPTTAGRTQPSFTSARGMLFKRASRPNRGIFRSCKVYRILATVVKAMPTG